jgi:hypothetical protein
MLIGPPEEVHVAAIVVGLAQQMPLTDAFEPSDGAVFTAAMAC